jgi:hypothetical protein
VALSEWSLLAVIYSDTIRSFRSPRPPRPPNFAGNDEISLAKSYNTVGKKDCGFLFFKELLLLPLNKRFGSFSAA